MLKRKGFTLIELLVVIAIIALLLSIILPAIKLAKEKTEIVLCSSNQRQLAMGVATYAEDNNGYLPPTPSTTYNSNGKLIVNGAGKTSYHRPYELNWNNNASGTITNPQASRNYQPISKSMGSYFDEVNVYNCRVSKIKDDTPWPPTNPIGNYGDFYRNGNYASLHSTFALLWNYQGYNAKLSTAYDASISEKSFEGPSRMSSKNKLIVQDALFTKDGGSNNWEWAGTQGVNLQSYWLTSHRFRSAESFEPYYAYDRTLGLPDVWLNAAYLDGHTERFNASTDTVVVKNWQARTRLTRKFR